MDIDVDYAGGLSYCEDGEDHNTSGLLGCDFGLLTCQMCLDDVGVLLFHVKQLFKLMSSLAAEYYDYVGALDQSRIRKCSDL